MFTIKKIVSAALITTVLTLTACANVSTKKIPPVPGTDTRNVNLFVNNDTGEVILSGQVKRELDKLNVEKSVREKYGYTNISNQITFD